MKKLFYLLVLFGFVFTSQAKNTGFEALHEAFKKKITTNIDSAALLAEQLLSKARNANDRHWEARALIDRATASSYMGDFYGAMSRTLEALEIAKEINNKEIMISAYFDLGMYHMQTGNNVEALQHYLDALKLAEEKDDREKMAHLMANIGTVYSLEANYEKASSYFTKAFTISNERNDRTFAARLCISMAENATHMQEYTKAVEYANKAITVYTDNNDQYGLVTAYQVLGDVYNEKGETTAAEKHYREALKQAASINAPGKAAEINLALGNMAYKNKRNKTALDYTNAAITKAREIQNMYMLRTCYDLCYRIYIDMNKAKEADIYKKMYDQVNDSLQKEEALRKTYEMQMARQKSKLELEKRNIEKKIEAEKSRRVDEKKQEQNTRLYLFFGCVLGALLIVLIVVLINKRKKIS